MDTRKIYKIDDREFIPVELGQNSCGIHRSVFVLVDTKDKSDLDIMLNRHAEIEAQKIANKTIDDALLKMTKQFLGIKTNPNQP